MPATTNDYLDAAQELTQTALRWSETTVQESTRAWLEMLDSLAPRAAGSESLSGLPKPRAVMNAGLGISDDLLAAQRDLATAFSVAMNGVGTAKAAEVAPVASTATPVAAAPVAQAEVEAAEVAPVASTATPVAAAPVAQAEVEADELPFPGADTATIPETLAALEDASDEQLARFIAWERENKARKTLLGTLEG